MAITVKHNKVSTVPDGDDTSVVRPSDWNADHTLVGVGTMAEQNSNNVNITGGSITGVTGLGDVTGPASATDNAIARFDTTTGKLIQNSVVTVSDTGGIAGATTITDINYVDFNTAYNTTLGTGQLGWDGNNTLGLGMSGGNIVQEIGLQTFIYGKASSAITKGQLIRKTGAVGSSGVITFAPTIANMTNSTDIIGIAAENVALNAFGYIMSTGNLRGFNTTGSSSGETWADGDTLYYNPSGNGLMTKVKPSAPNTKTEVASVTNAASGGSGSVVVEIIHGSQLGGTDSNVQITSPTTGQTLVYNQSTDIWNNSNAPTIIGGSINNTPIGATTASTGRFSDLTDTGLTSGRVTYATTGGNLTDSANLTFNGTTLVANDITDSSLTATRVVYAGTGGNLRDASNFTYDGTNLVAGAIQNTPIGATTPSSIVGTTITGQTGVLRGTGTNLVTQSQTFSTWTRNALGLSANSVQAPDGTTTAATFTGDGTSGTHTAQFTQSANSFARTWSCYLKAGTNNFVQLMFGTDVNAFANFDLNAGTLGTVGSAATATITSAGSGWYRCVVTTSSTTATNVFITLIASGTSVRFESNSLSTTIFAWGAQFELGSTANTYIPTTTTAVYGTPTLSFSGVSTLGLESNGALFLQPAGTGAIQAQATTSTTAGGNARGANAVDWQTTRVAASNVASGAYTTIGGGLNNTSNSFASTIAGGGSNGASNFYAFIGGGSGNQASGYSSVAIGGISNTASGYYGFVGNGFTNSTTSNSAVTTQSGTMNGTTAVTLSGSNANIRVGQYITGTSIASDTYVAAISGTSLTLSKNASGSSTSTLSFFTPHGVVVGGGNNQATGAYSFIGGGGDAGTAANRNVASGDWSFVGGGRNNTASGIGSVIAGGGTFAGGANANTASGAASFVGGGFSNNATNFASIVIGGNGNTSSGNYSCVTGVNGSTRSINNNFVISSNAISVTGDSQTAILVLRTQTTNATATALTSDGSAATTNNQVILPNNSAYLFKATVISGVTGGGNTSGWKLEGVIKRGANAASTAIVGSVTTTLLAQDAGASGWVIAATADTTNGGLRITFTGQASTTIRTVCKVETTEVTY